MAHSEKCFDDCKVQKCFCPCHVIDTIDKTSFVEKNKETRGRLNENKK